MVFTNYLLRHSLCAQRHTIACASASTCLNQLCTQKLVRWNKYYKHSIVHAKIVFIIIFLIMKLLMIFSKNLHNKNLQNSKLHNGLETQVFLKYHWNLNISEILQGVSHMNNILELLLKYHFYIFITSIKI